MPYELVDPKIFDSLDLDLIVRKTPLAVVRTKKLGSQMASQLPRVLVEVENLNGERRFDLPLAFYFDIRNSKQYPKLKAWIECQISTHGTSQYQVICKRRHGDQREQLCIAQADDYEAAKARVAGWIALSIAWLADSWGDVPSSTVVSAPDLVLDEPGDESEQDPEFGDLGIELEG